MDTSAKYHADEKWAQESLAQRLSGTILELILLGNGCIRGGFHDIADLYLHSSNTQDILDDGHSSITISLDREIS
jgi:hypothetical protein